MFDSTSLPEPVTTIPKAPRPGSIPQPRPEAAPVDMVPDWNAIGLFATGLALGAILGATAALLLAPASGEETRHRIVNRVRNRDDDDVWDQLAEELDRVASESKAEARETEAALT